MIRLHFYLLNSSLLALLLVAPLQAATISVAANPDFRVAGQNLQSAINSAQPGDTILVAAGGSFQGPITLPSKSGSYTGYITIRTSAADASLPAAGTRISPTYSSFMPKILGGGGLPAIQTAAYAHHYQLIGIEFMPASPAEVVYQIVQLGDVGPNQTTLAQVPHHLTLDRCYVHAFPNADSKIAILLNSASTDIVNSYISEMHSQIQESQAIDGYNGPGPYNILNNYLEAAAENVMFGGAPPTIPNLVPSNITIARNDFNKLLAWKNWDKVDAATYAYYQANDPSRLVRFGDRLVPNFIIHTPNAYTPIVKNLFELKNGQDVTLNGNTFSNNWVQADQLGQAIQLTPRTESGAVPWAVVQRVSFTNNIFRNVGGWVNIGDRDTGQTSPATNRIAFSNNLVDELRQDYSYDYERVVQFTGIDRLTFDHNTYLHNSYMMFAYQTPSSNFVYTNNIVSYADGLNGDCGYRLAMLACQFTGNPPYVFAGNVVIGGSLSGIPAGNLFPLTNNDVGFVNAANLQADYRNYALSLSSPFKGKATDGGDPGFSPAGYDAARSIPTADSITPNAGSGLVQTFQATYSDTAGWANLAYTELLINGSLTGAGACWVIYLPSANTLYLYNDSASALSGPITAGAPGALQNSQCTLDGGGSSASGSGNRLTVNLALTFKSSFFGPKNIYLLAFNATVNSGWQNFGTWTIPVIQTPPTTDSVTPGLGSGSSQTFTFKYSSLNGSPYLNDVYALFNTAISGAGACLPLYDRSTNSFYLYNDAGTGLLGPLTPGAAGTLSNGQCTLTGTGSQVSGSGNTLTVVMNLSFTGAFHGAKTIFMYAADAGDLASGWQMKGTWNVPAIANAPTADSVTPSSGLGSSQVFTFQYSSINGAPYLNDVYALFNTAINGAGACLPLYDTSTNNFYLYNDAGTGLLGPLTPGAAGTLSNSQCTLTGTGSQVSGSGNTLTMVLNLSFKASFIGAKTIFMYAADAGGLASGWQSKGAWIVQ